MAGGDIWHFSVANLEFGTNYYIEVREGNDNNKIQGQNMFTSNVLVDTIIPSASSWGVSGGGISLKTQ